MDRKISKSEPCLDGLWDLWFTEEYLPENLGFLPENFRKLFKKTQEELDNCEYIANFKIKLEKVLDKVSESRNSSLTDLRKDDTDILCYGLGSFGLEYIGRYQLAFLLILKRILNPIDSYIYDPEFCAQEIDFLKEVGFQVLDIDEEGERKLRRKTVCYMPYPPTDIFDNLLRSNWSAEELSQCIIISNSFEDLSDALDEGMSDVSSKLKYLKIAKTFVTEIRIQNSFRLEEAFHLLSIHHFEPSSLALVDPLVWTVPKKPHKKKWKWNCNVVPKKLKAVQ